MDIKKLRIKKGMSQQELADELGIHVNTIKNWESGKSTISPKKRHLLLDIITTFESPMVSETQNNYGLPEELSYDIVEDLRQQIYILKDALKDKDEIIAFLKDKLKQYES